MSLFICCYAECRYPECRYADSRGAIETTQKSIEEHVLKNRLNHLSKYNFETIEYGATTIGTTTLAIMTFYLFGLTATLSI